jgi:ribosomal protein L21E
MQALLELAQPSSDLTALVLEVIKAGAEVALKTEPSLAEGAPHRCQKIRTL